MFSEAMSFLHVSTCFSYQVSSGTSRQEPLLCVVVIYHWTKAIRLWLGWNRWDALGILEMWFKLWFMGVFPNLQRPDSLSFQTTFCVGDTFKPIRTRQQNYRIEVFERSIHASISSLPLYISLLCPAMSSCFDLRWFELVDQKELCLRLCVRISSKLVVWSCAESEAA